MRLSLAQVVAIGAAVSNQMPSRRIAMFLSGLNGHTIPDEEGNYWQARVELDAGMVRLEGNPASSRYQELRIPLVDADSFWCGAPLVEEEKLPDPGQSPVLGLGFEKARLLAGLVAMYRQKLEKAGLWTDEDSELLVEWVETLEPEEREEVCTQGEPSLPAPAPSEPGEGEQKTLGLEGNASP